MDMTSVSAHLQHLDPTSLAVGAVVARTIEAALIRAIKPLPALAVGLLKRRVQSLVASGKVDAPTVKLLKSYAKATFDWVDEVLPDSPGPDKMDAALDRLAAIPYLGVLVRADRDGARQVLQAAYDAVDAEAKAQAAALGAAYVPTTPKTEASPAPPPPATPQ